MRAKTVNTNLPTFDELCDDAPEEIRKLISDCKTTSQSEFWHPEGSVYNHERIVYNRASKTRNIDMAMAAFFHDLGKTTTTVKNNKGSWSSPGHESHSAHIVSKYRFWIEEYGADYERVYNIVKHHMRIKLMDEMRPAKRAEFMKNPYIKELMEFSKFDNMQTLSPDELS